MTQNLKFLNFRTIIWELSKKVSFFNLQSFLFFMLIPSLEKMLEMQLTITKDDFEIKEQELNFLKKKAENYAQDIQNLKNSELDLESQLSDLQMKFSSQNTEK